MSIEAEHNPLPSGWRWVSLDEVAYKLPTGPLFDRESCKSSGKIPVVDQSEEGLVGYHDDLPGIFASKEQPVVTFANHTCAVRLLKASFSVIQNVFPLRARGDVDTDFLYWLLFRRIRPSFYGGHWPKLVETKLPSHLS